MKKVLIIGSGPIIIGQAAEFDYSGTQACLALREAGVHSVVVNSNPATIQTDTEIAGTIYIEPLTVPSLTNIIAKEKPDGLIATVGGQTGLNLAVLLSKQGILKKFGVKVLGTGIDSILKGEDRGAFAECMNDYDVLILPGKSVSSTQEAFDFAKAHQYPIIIRSAFNLGGTGSSIAYSKKELKTHVDEGIRLSMNHSVLVEKSVLGWAELEYEIIRDNAGNTIMIAAMENIDPMGIHTGESIVVTPIQTIPDVDHQAMRKTAIEIVEALDIRGSCNIQFAYDHKTHEYVTIEVNPRLSRSSALASKATGYPIARIATQIALGKNLPEIVNPITGKTACFEPALDYVVVKIPKWPDEKFPDMVRTIGITMKSTGEAMGIGKTFEEALYKAMMSVGIFRIPVNSEHSEYSDDQKILSRRQTDQRFQKKKKISLKQLAIPTTHRLLDICSFFQHLNLKSQLVKPKKAMSLRFRLGGRSNPIRIQEDVVYRLIFRVSKATGIHSWFLYRIFEMVKSWDILTKKSKGQTLLYHMVDTCAGEFTAQTPYFYSSCAGGKTHHTPLPEPKVIILGSGPIKIGQGIEFDYVTVQAVRYIQKRGIKVIVINNNPETVSTDYAMSDRLYCEPLTPSYVNQIIKHEKDGLLGVITQFGGQTGVNLTLSIPRSIPILGTSRRSIIRSENRYETAKMIGKLGILMPEWRIAQSTHELQMCVQSLGYPVLIRPSFVLAGEGMAVISSKQEFQEYLTNNHLVFNSPVLVDRFIANAREFDIDFISNGTTTLSFISEQLDPSGIHSGDSRAVYPIQSLSNHQILELEEITATIAHSFGIVGIGNIQVVLKDGKWMVLEVNPRASRTVPFVTKTGGEPLIKYAVDAIFGKPIPTKPKLCTKVGIKYPVFSTHKLIGVSNTLGPVMKSTGEVMGMGKTMEGAIGKMENGKTSGANPGQTERFPLLSKESVRRKRTRFA